MRFFICAVLFTCVICLNSVQSMFPAPNGNRHVSFNGVRYPVPIGGSFHRTRIGLCIPDLKNDNPIIPIDNDELKRAEAYIGLYKIEKRFKGLVPILYPSSAVPKKVTVEVQPTDYLVRKSVEIGIYEEDFGFRALKMIAPM